MSESIPVEAFEAKRTRFIEDAKKLILDRLRPIIEYKIRETIAPGTITEEQELNQFYVDEAVSEHEASGKKHPYKLFSDFSKEHRSNGGE